MLSTISGRPIRQTSARTNVSRARVQPVKALFGFGKKNEEVDEAKEEMYQAQLEILKERRAGKGMEKVKERRAGVANYLKLEKEAREKAYREGKNVELPGKKNIPVSKQYGEDDGNGGIIIPLAPFGIPKFDNGERFDLKAPYAEKGWVDPEAGDWTSGFKKLFGGGKKEEKPEEDGKGAKGKKAGKR